MLIWILLVAAIVVAALQEWIEFALILGVVTLNVMIGMVQEGKAEKAAEAIKAMLSASGALRGRERARDPAVWERGRHSGGKRGVCGWRAAAAAAGVKSAPRSC